MLGSVTLIVVLTAGAISADRGTVADSVLSRGISRYQYFLGKWHARLAAVLGTYLALGVTALVSSLFLLLRRRMGGVNGSVLAPAAARMTLAALLMGVCLYAFLALAGGLSIWLVAAGALAVGSLTYFVASWLAGLPEATRVPQFLLRRAKV